MPDQLIYHFQSLAGMSVILAAAWAFSENRRAFPFRTVASGLALQFALALVLLKVPAARAALLSLNVIVNALTGATRAGTSFVFGYVGGGAPPFAVTSARGMSNFAFQILPLVIVISALAALLWHWRILPLVVNAVDGLRSTDAELARGLRAIPSGLLERSTDQAPLQARYCLAQSERCFRRILERDVPGRCAQRVWQIGDVDQLAA